MRISPAYLDEQKRLHAQPQGYGGRGSKWTDTILELTAKTDVETILDYGAGQGSLGRELRKAGFYIDQYDPAVAKIAKLPRGPFDLVVCTDVLEHVEEDCLGEVLADLRTRADDLVFLVISLVETAKTLSDGRQAHITLHPRQWWLDRLLASGIILVEEIQNRPEKQFVGLFRSTSCT